MVKGQRVKHYNVKGPVVAKVKVFHFKDAT